MTENEKLLTLWGKTKDGTPNCAEYHPLFFHLLDVACAARELWKLLPRRPRRRIARALGLSEEDAAKVLVLLTGIHDLGKASAFQVQAEHLWKAVRKTGLDIAHPKACPHAFVTAKVLPALLTEEDVCGWTAPLLMANALAAITGAHHGRFPAPSANFGTSTLGGPEWDNIRRELATALAKALYPNHPTTAISKEVLDDAGAGAILTGFISVADWIGSTKAYFKAEGTRKVKSPEDYLPDSEGAAVKALAELGWREVQFADPRPFPEMIWGEKTEAGRPTDPIRFAPRPLQATVATLAEGATGPYLMIIEAAMGDGKTEAALYAADRAITTTRADGERQADGFYIALPTQATGNAMFVRVKAFLTHRGHSGALNLQLVHGGAEFNDEFKEIKKEIELTANATNEGEEAPVVAERWFTSKKQALLAPFGVGTIDQSLLGVLQTKHWFVRLFGLAGKVVVFDEVHAYDVYMGELLEALVRWLSELDCTVILLSATLPAARRQKLMEAYQRGATVEAAPYPRVTFVPGGGVAQSVPVEGDSGRRTDVTLERAPADYDALAEKISRDLPGGGCAAVLCNTVAQAQKAHDAIAARLEPEGWKVILFHARTPLKWRKDKEKAVLNYFGKPDHPDVERPEKAVLIGTQVLEQSLDYDVDWMASEMAPADLLLQRMGRLWRHDRPARPAITTTARFVVLLDEPGNGIPGFPPGSESVYDRYILLRSALALCGKTAVTLPADIEPLVKAVYDDPEAAPDDSWQEQLTKARERLEAEQNDHAGKAASNAIPSPPPVPFSFDKAVIRKINRDMVDDDDDPATHKDVRATTRLGDPSLTLVCLRRSVDGILTPFCGGGKVNVAYKTRPAPEQVRELLESSLPLSRPKGLFHALLKEEVPEGWQKDAHLQYARHLVFDDTGKATLGAYTVTLDEKRGLVVVKEESE
jgi:CRISPR-associated endonuclease/helicase Cas3